MTECSAWAVQSKSACVCECVSGCACVGGWLAGCSKKAIFRNCALQSTEGNKGTHSFTPHRPHTPKSRTKRYVPPAG